MTRDIDDRLAVIVELIVELIALRTREASSQVSRVERIVLALHEREFGDLSLDDLRALRAGIDLLIGEREAAA